MAIAATYTLRLSGKVRDYLLLVKFRLSLVVVFSAVMGYLLALYGDVSWGALAFLTAGGFLVTGSANALNQLLEKDLDKLMSRTGGRPVASGRMSPVEAAIAAGIMGVAGVLILWASFNITAAMLGCLSLLTYAFIYTPLKRLSPAAVFVGAIPGALPPLIGWVAADGALSYEAFLIFSIQFIWQFPHFWAIAWVLDDDYKKAGFRLLPSRGGRDKVTATQVLFYTLILIPVSVLPVKMGLSGGVSTFIILTAGAMFFFQALALYRKTSVTAAHRLMLGSFLYLPVVLIALLMDKI